MGYLFTVITATYNRAHTLSRLYESLLLQIEKNFQWLIIDDGSDDGTPALVKAWQAEGKLSIEYHWWENAGKHRALNEGVRLAQGEWTTMVDSDDWVTAECLTRVAELIVANAGELSKSNIAGFVFLSKYESGLIVGNEFPFESMIGRAFEVYDRHGIEGDKFHFYRTSVLVEFPFPEIPGEKFISEGIVWNRVNNKYLSFFVNQAHQLVEYQRDGLSRRSLINRIQSPTGACLLYAEATELNQSFMARLRSASNYYRFRLHGGRSRAEDLKVEPALVVMGLLLGLALYVSDFFRVSLSGSK